MAISDKEAARRIIDALPDDATLDDAAQRLAEAGQLASLARPNDAGGAASSVAVSGVVDYHLERHGRFTVLAPDRPVPPLSEGLFIEMIAQERLEREARFLGLPNSDD
jgi:hypothetical protein